MVIYFHEAVTKSSDGLPKIPSDVLLLMGMSSAVYLTGKDIGTKASAPQDGPPNPPAPGAGAPAGKAGQ